MWDHQWVVCSAASRDDLSDALRAATVVALRVSKLVYEMVVQWVEM